MALKISNRLARLMWLLCLLIVVMAIGTFSVKILNGFQLIYGDNLSEHRDLQTFLLTQNHIDEIASVRKLNHWRVLQCEQLPENHSADIIASYCKNVPEFQSEVRITLWINEGEDVIKYLFLTHREVPASASLSPPVIRLGENYADCVKRLKDDGYESCGFSELFDWKRWLATGEIQQGYPIISHDRIPELFVEESRLVDKGKKLRTWHYWEVDSRGGIIDRGMHGSP